MGLFILYAVNLLLLTTVINTWAYIEKKIEGKLPEVESVKKFLELFIQPYIQPAARRSYQEDLVDKVIMEKIKTLKPLLQDQDDHDASNRLKLEGNGETTIIEVLSKPISRQGKHKHANSTTKDKINNFKRQINRYKKMKKKIIKMLHKESVSKKTEKYIAKSMDQMIQQLVKNQCSWKSVPNKIAERRREGNHTYSQLTSEEWNEVKMHYGNLLKNRNVKEALSYLHQSVNFFSKLSEVFNIQCNVAGNQTDLRRHNNNNCDNFVICTQELQDFLKSYYLALNNTAVSAFRNYAEMYWRDVNNDDHLQKGKVISVVKNVSNTVERIVSKMVRKEIIKLNLDANKNKDANIRILKDFVIDTGERVKNHVSKHMETDFASLRAIIVMNVKKDIDVNLRMDVESLQRQFIDQLCKIFTACNGNYIIKGDSRRNLHIKDANSVYVKLQLNVDEDIKNEMAKNKIEYFREGVNDRANIQITVKKPAITRTTSEVRNTRYKPSKENTVIGTDELFPRKEFKDTQMFSIDNGRARQRVQLVSDEYLRRQLPGQTQAGSQFGNLTVLQNSTTNSTMDNTAKIHFIDLE